MKKEKKELLIMWVKRDLVYILCILLLLGTTLYSLVKVKDFERTCNEYWEKQISQLYPNYKPTLNLSSTDFQLPPLNTS